MITDFTLYFILIKLELLIDIVLKSALPNIVDNTVFFRCEYEMHFETPAACSKPNLNHDEL